MTPGAGSLQVSCHQKATHQNAAIVSDTSNVPQNDLGSCVRPLY